MSLSAPDTLPRYKQIAYHILEAIQLGDYLPGEKLPSEHQLATQYQVHRLTVRHAMDFLDGQGIIYRHQGKGAFVAYPQLRYHIGESTSFSHSMLDLGYLPSVKILSVKTLPATPALADLLEVPQNTPLVEIKILRNAAAQITGPKISDFQPLCLSCSYLQQSKFPQIEQHIYHTQSLYRLLKGRYGIFPQRCWTRIVAESATAELIERLEMPPQVPILMTQSLAQTQQGVPVEYTISQFRGDRFTLEVTA